jgi:O-antigen biosynthesis protein
MALQTGQASQHAKRGGQANLLTQCRSAWLEMRCRGGVFACAGQLPDLLRCFGWKRGLKFLVRYIKRNDYQTWIRLYDTPDRALDVEIQSRITGMVAPPTLSVLMPVVAGSPRFLREAVAMVKQQSYPHWELCIIVESNLDAPMQQALAELAQQDLRIRVEICQAGSDGLRSGEPYALLNAALPMVSGAYVMSVNCSDVLAKHALFYCAERLLADPEAAMLYTDHDQISMSGTRYAPHFKCAFNLELLLAQNGLGPLVVYRTALLREIGGWQPGFTGAEDFELVLRAIELLKPSQIIHIPRALYHQRTMHSELAAKQGRPSQIAASGRRAVSAYLTRTGRGGQVCPCPEAPQYNRFRYCLPDALPLVSIVIPTRDRADLLQMCVDSILQKSTYRHIEILIVDNGSVEVATQALFNRLPTEQVRILRDDAPFNYARLNNLAVRQARGEVICLMNNDIEILSTDWLEEMLSWALQPDVGCVGARLWFPDGRLQHAGVLTGLGEGIAGHPNKYFPRGYPGYFGRAVLAQAFSAITAACLMVRRQVWEQVGGLDESLAVAFNDVDFCLRVQAAG